MWIWKVGKEWAAAPSLYFFLFLCVCVCARARACVWKEWAAARRKSRDVAERGPQLPMYAPGFSDRSQWTFLVMAREGRKKDPVF